jgi:hypothetical protein
VVADTATEEQARTRRIVSAMSGRNSNMLSGIAMALKKRLGE